MAKSARSSDRKRNNRNLRAKVFGPASDARTERLSMKLQELAAKPKPEAEKAMDIDESEEQLEGELQAEADQGLDVQMRDISSARPASSKKKHTSRVEKKKPRTKARNQVIFPTSAAKRKRIDASKRKGA